MQSDNRMSSESCQPLVAPYLNEEGHCLFHPDLLFMECTLVARLGCIGCIYSTRNLDPIELPEGPTAPPSSPPGHVHTVEIDDVC